MAEAAVVTDDSESGPPMGVSLCVLQAAARSGSGLLTVGGV